jgi:hypothetical protein
MKRALLVLTVLTLSVVLISCSYVPFAASSKRAANAPVLAPADPATVAILADPPTVPYVTLGEIRVDMKGMRSTRWVAQDPTVKAAIREEAGKLGADAVIVNVIQERSMGHRPDGLGVTDSPVAHHVLLTAIRTGR